MRTLNPAAGVCLFALVAIAPGAVAPRGAVWGLEPAGAEGAAAVAPRALQPGDTIGLVAPASALSKPLIQKAVANLSERGYRVTVAAGSDKKLGYLAGDDGTRAKGINSLLRNPKVRAVVCLRGGYGSPRLLEYVDYGALRRDPKIIVGYSDITALLLAVRQKAGVITFHGPMGKEWGTGRGPSPYAEDRFWSALTGKGKLEDWCGRIPPGLPKPRALVGGRAEGILTGGNLSVVCALMGTPYAIDTQDAILFIEDVSEKLFRIDRMLNQLRLAGKLKTLRGVVIGAFAGCEKNAEGIERREVFLDYFGGLSIPVVVDFPAGHVADNVTLPLGARVRLDADAGTLTLLAPPVRKP